MSPTVHLRVSKTERSLASPAFGRGALDFDPRELETPGEAVAEVVVSHGATVLDVQHVGQTRGRDRYTLGETPEASFPVSADALPGGQTFVLVQRHGDRYALRFTAQMRGEVHWSGRTLDLRALVAQGLATPTAGGHRFVLPDGARARLEHGRVTYQVATVARARSIARKAEADKPLWLCNAGSAAVLGTLLALVHLVPDDALAMSLDDITADNRFVGYIHQPDRPEPAERGLDGDARGATEPSSSAAASGPAPASGAKAHPQGARSPAEPAVGRSVAQASPLLRRGFDPLLESRQAGILGVLEQSSGHVLASSAALAFAPGSDDQAWSELAGTGVAADFGVGGVGLRGTGRQGGGNADGTVAFGPAGLLGKQRSGGGDRYDRGGIGHGERRARAPRVRADRGGDVRGSIDPDDIRRVVRNHINQVRHCYNQGLLRDPNLRGRVEVRFSIGPAGKVVGAAVVDDGLADRDVGACVSQAVRRWTFPRPRDGGSAVVTYPFAFSPG